MKHHILSLLCLAAISGAEEPLKPIPVPITSTFSLPEHWKDPQIIWISTEPGPVFSETWPIVCNDDPYGNYRPETTYLDVRREPVITKIGDRWVIRFRK